MYKYTVWTNVRGLLKHYINMGLLNILFLNPGYSYPAIGRSAIVVLSLQSELQFIPKDLLAQTMKPNRSTKATVLLLLATSL